MEHQKTAEGTGDWISSKTADVVRSEILAARAKSYNSKFINVSKIHNKIIQTARNENDKEIPKEISIPLEEKQKIRDNLTFNIIL